ncbi:hypothetical protein EDD17DRAFT_1516405, partial [Pisolithus thermaeus]
MFVKNSPALQDAVDHILTIFEMLIINLGRLEEVEKLEQWRNAESVRSIANRTDNIPHLLIGMDKYICWTENLGKGKGVDPSEQKGAKVAMAEVAPIPLEDDNGDTSKVVKEDIEMDNIEPASTLKNTTFSIMNGTKGRKSIASKGEDDIIHHQDQMMGQIDEGEQQMAEVFCRIAVQTPGTVEDCMQMLENELAEHRHTIATLTHELEAFCDNSMQTPHVDTDMTETTSNIIELQDENVGSPSSKSASREVMPTRGEPPAIDQGVELLATESSDNGRQADQGEAANIVEATAVAGEAQPVVVAEGGIG